MRYRSISGLALLAAFAAWQMVPADHPGIDPFVSASVAPSSAHEFIVTNLQAHTACIARRGAALTGRSRDFSAEAGCDEVWPGLASARNWTENGDGSVILSDERGEQVLTISVGDGVAYEALDPDDASLTLTAVN